MKNWITLILAIALLINSAFAAPQVVDKVVAVINNGVLLESDVEGMMQSVKTQAKQSGQQLPDDHTLRHQIVEQLIMENILLQMGKQMGVVITDQQLDEAIAGIAARNKITAAQLRSQLAYSGIDYNTFRQQTRKQIMISEVRNNEVRRRITILPQEVDALATQLAAQNASGTQLNISNILLPLPENPTQTQVDQQESQAKQLIKQLNEGADFGKLAVSYSADSQALKGGEMGWAKIEELPTLFTQALSTAKKGDIVGPIRSGVGFHILKVNDLRGEVQNVSVTEVHARHILLKTSPVVTDEQAQQRLTHLAADIRSGKISFSAAAKQFSEDPASSNQGGDLGWISTESFDPAFRDALIKLKKGQLSQPVHSTFGWHLIELLDTRQADKTEAAQKQRAYGLLFNRKFAEEAQSWMQEQRASAYIKIVDANAK